MPQLKRLLLVIIASFVLFNQSFSISLAAYDPSLVGPQAPVGPVATVGPVASVGPQYEGYGIGPSATPIPSPSPSPIPSPSASTNAAAAGSGAAGNGGTSAATGNTGANSNNETNINKSNETDITQNNNANAVNNVNANATTGGNSASMNTGNSKANSGDINGQITVINVANARTLEGSTLTSKTLEGDQHGTVVVGGGATTSLLSGTGANSNNLTNINDKNSFKVTINRDARAENNITVNADTGHNSADLNTGSGEASSGNVQLALNVINLLNLVSPIDIQTTSVFGNVIGNLLFPTDVATKNTGANSNNETNVNKDDKLKVTTTNKADIDNKLNYNLTTGGNSAGGNTLGGETSSGTVSADTVISNIANAPANMIYLINVYGECDCDLSELDPSKYVLNVVDGSASADTENTGANSNNETNINSSNDTEITQNNTGTVKNNINVNANTGGNSANNNTGKGKATSGNIDVKTTITNMVNAAAASGQKLILGIINIFGNWKGKATTKTTTPPPTTVASAGTTQTTTNAQSNGTSFNSIPAPVQPVVTVAAPPVTPAIQVATSQSTSRQPRKLATSIGSSSSTNSGDNEITVDTQTNLINQVNQGTGNFTVTEPETHAHGSVLAAVAHAAEKGSAFAASRKPLLFAIAIPAMFWLFAELILAQLAKRQKAKQV